ncbi:TetR/AcrR family transcriptional regulator [Bifidobacterium pseudolongum]|uniref:TetR/AcrR family transcriptional regulator n=1 Tax=Bifidobacterium pseudolongum TaxID=1694 RepID=UPI001021DECE|nr:TetR/AcrR family transcriptional regulator [Bifidobacterium pseudolongum]RYQ63642.1 AcrR family transcriptional regulator [Bifidobacterium pseudolongum subsp. globosum]
MPRPRRDSEILPAKERLENAFWTLLADRPFGKITVTDVVHEARVNRNSFYYHFSGLPELADSAIMVEIERLPFPPVPDSHDDPLVVWHTFCSSMVASPENIQRIDHLALLTSSHSTRDLVESLRDFMRLTLLSLLDETPSSINNTKRVLLDFAVGGILSLLSHWPSMRHTVTLREMQNRDVAVLAMGLYVSMSRQDTDGFWERLYLDSAHLGGKDSAITGLEAYRV